MDKDSFCWKSRLYFSDRIDGQPLPLVRGLIVRWHFFACPLCQRYLRSLTATRDAARSLRDPDPE
jgi:hypothetical protein